MITKLILLGNVALITVGLVRVWQLGGRKPKDAPARGASLRKHLEQIRRDLARGAAFRPRLVGDRLRIRWGGINHELRLVMALDDVEGWRVDKLISEMRMEDALVPEGTVLKPLGRQTVLPSGWTRLGPCMVRSTDLAELQTRMRPAVIRDAIGYLSAYGRVLGYRGGTLLLEAYDPLTRAIPEMVRRQLVVAQALCAESNVAWQELGRELGLEFEAWARPPQWRLSGRYQEQQVAISCRLDQQPRCSQVTVTLSAPMPRELQIHGIRAGDPPGLDLRDPILSGRLRVLGEPEAAVRALLARPGMHGELLELTQEWGGRIQGQRLVAEVSGVSVDTLRRCLDGLIPLSRLLGTAPGAAGDSTAPRPDPS